MIVPFLLHMFTKILVVLIFRTPVVAALELRIQLLCRFFTRALTVFVDLDFRGKIDLHLAVCRVEGELSLPQHVLAFERKTGYSSLDVVAVIVVDYLKSSTLKGFHRIHIDF